MDNANLLSDWVLKAVETCLKNRNPQVGSFGPVVLGDKVFVYMLLTMTGMRIL